MKTTFSNLKHYLAMTLDTADNSLDINETDAHTLMVTDFMLYHGEITVK